MRIAAAVFCVLLILFTVVQYNDPDALWWGLIYGAGALWCAVALVRPGAVTGPVGRILMLISLILCVGGVVYYWPKTPGWWRQDVWWETETAREGMGMMIVLIAIAIAWFAARSGQRARM